MPDEKPDPGGEAACDPDAEPRSLVFYDRDCGFCRWSLAQVLAWDRGHRLRPVALQDAEARARLGHLDHERMFASAHVVTPEGRVYSGGDAVAPILRLLPGGPSLAVVAGLMRGPSRIGYNWIARHRGMLGRPVPESARARAIARIDRH